MAETREQSNRRIRQEALREQLSSQKHVEHVIDLLKKVEEPPTPLDTLDLQRYKLVIDTKMKLINKYLPDLKSTELTGDPDNPVQHDHVIEFIGIAD